MEDLRILELFARTILLSQITNNRPTRKVSRPTAGSVSLNEIEELEVNQKLFFAQQADSF